MKLYEEYKKIVKELGRVKKAYFTTFNISPEFVERYILPPLLEENIPKNALGYEALNQKLENKPDIKFFHDANMTKFDEGKKTNVAFYPIVMTTGVFHPKVIYLEGDKAIYLIVGSGNLTLSGWGRNREAFRILKVDKSSNLDKQAHNFFVDVFKKSGLKKTNKKTTINNEDINLVYGFDKTSNFLDSLELSKNLQVWSPYFSDLDELLVNEEFQSLESIKIIPDINKHEKTRLKKLPENKNVSFHIDEKFEDTFNHSKVWISDTKIAIGSHNMTKQAVYGNNFEASLVETIENEKIFLVTNDSFSPKINKESDMEEVDEVLTEERFSGLFKLVANWKSRTLTLEEIYCIGKLKNIKIILPSNLKKSNTELKSINTVELATVFSTLGRNKIFTIKDGDKIIFRGFIIEEETAYRDKVKAESLEDIFLSFEEKGEARLVEQLEERILNKTLGISVVQKKHHIKQNYFSMFKGFKALNEKLEKLKTKDLHSFCYSSVTSLTSIMIVLEKEKDNEETLFLYLCIGELNKLIFKANKMLKKEPKLKKLKNITILNPEDKNFLKACST